VSTMVNHGLLRRVLLSGCLRSSCDAPWPPEPAQDVMMREDDVTKKKGDRDG